MWMSIPFALESRQATTKGLKSTSFQIKIIMVTAKHHRKMLKKPVKYKLTPTINTEENTSAQGVFASTSGLTTVPNQLPVTGKAELNPARILAKPKVMSSGLVLSAIRYCKALLGQLK